ncbi:recombinase family protein [Pseudonocardia alni]|uniref:recombinase family protein n=1 Tax=Pseudonocardia alni TaxID=33907 RepID=UPI00331C5B0B
MTRAATYLRISADRTGEGHGVDRQRTDCRDLIERRAWTETLEFCENDTSAAGRKPRPKFKALLAAIRAGQVDVVVAWALDRLARTARDRLALIEACRDAGVVIALVRGSDMDPTSAAGRLAIGILGEVAQHEIDQKSERQRRAVLQAAEQGRWVGGRRPFGYESKGKEIIPAEAAAVREGYAAVLAGDSLRSVAGAWNAAGFTTGQSPWKHRELGEFSPWRADSVRRVLMNPRYAGIRTLRRDGMLVEFGDAEWEGIVPEETFRAAVAVLSDATRRTGGTADRQFLTGLAVCALDGCGLPVHGGGAKHGKPIYRCRSTQMLPERRPDVEGTHVNRLAGPVDEYVERLVVGRLSQPDAAELLVDHLRADVPGLRDEIVILRTRLESYAAEQGLALADAHGEPMSPAEYAALRRPMLARIAEIEAQIADAGRVDVLGPLVGAEDVSVAWKALSPERRRAVVDVLMTVRLHAVGRGTRTFRPETIEVEWKTD